MSHGRLPTQYQTQQALARVIAEEVGQVEEITDNYVIIVKNPQVPRWVLHILLSLITFGFYLVVWGIVAFVEFKMKKRIVYSVDEYGQPVWADLAIQPLQWAICGDEGDDPEAEARHRRQQLPNNGMW